MPKYTVIHVFQISSDQTRLPPSLPGGGKVDSWSHLLPPLPPPISKGAAKAEGGGGIITGDWGRSICPQQAWTEVSNGAYTMCCHREVVRLLSLAGVGPGVAQFLCNLWSCPIHKPRGHSDKAAPPPTEISIPGKAGTQISEERKQPPPNFVCEGFIWLFLQKTCIAKWTGFF